jgi:hypothetical protein
VHARQQLVCYKYWGQACSDLIYSLKRSLKTIAERIPSLLTPVRVRYLPLFINVSLFAILLAVTTIVRAAFDIFVTPDANELLTIEDIDKDKKVHLSLQQAIAALKHPLLRNANNEPLSSIHIHLSAGIYRLTSPLLLNEAASGSESNQIVISGPENATAVLSGGIQVNGFSPIVDKYTKMRLPPNSRDKVLFANLTQKGITDFGRLTRRGLGGGENVSALEIFYRNMHLPLARWPNNSFATIELIPDGASGRRFSIAGTDTRAWSNETDLMAFGYWHEHWSDETIPIQSVDLKTGFITLEEPGHSYGIKTGQPVFIQNALSEIDEPGEWYLDRRSGNLYLWPPDFLVDGDVEASVLNNLLIVNDARHIRIADLTLELSRGDAIVARGVNNVDFSRLHIRNVGKRALVLLGKNSGISDSVVEDTGEGGVHLTGGDRQNLTPGNLYAKRNTIQRFGRVARSYRPAIRLDGVGNNAVANKITDSPHSAILFQGNDHFIAQNDIFRVCKETGDSGVIYTGRDWTARGTVISHNYIRNIPANIELGKTKGIYLDDQASGITIQGNIFIDVNEPVFIGGGRDNLVEHNIFLDTKPPVTIDGRGTSWQKPMTDDPLGTLRSRLNQVPYNGKDYITRYSNLANILEDSPGMPKYNLVRNNIYINNELIRFHDNARDGTTVSGNLRIGRRQ